MRRLAFAALALSITGCFHKGFLDDTPHGVPGYRMSGETPPANFPGPNRARAATK
jgi:hypothetical protein